MTEFMRPSFIFAMCSESWMLLASASLLRKDPEACLSLPCAGLRGPA